MTHLYTNSLHVISLLPTSNSDMAPKRPRALIIPTTIHLSRSPPSNGLPPPLEPPFVFGPKAPKDQGLIFCLPLEGGGGGGWAVLPDEACLASAGLPSFPELLFGGPLAPPGLKNFSKPLGGFSANRVHWRCICSRNDKRDPFFNIDNVRQSCNIKLSILYTCFDYSSQWLCY